MRRRFGHFLGSLHILESFVDAFSKRLESRILHPVIGILLSFTDFIISPGKIGGSNIQFVGFDKKRIE